MKELLINGGILFLVLSIQAYIQSTILNIVFNLELSEQQKCIFAFMHGVFSSLFKLFAPYNIYVFNPVFYVLFSTALLCIFKKNSFFKSLIYSLFLLVLSIPVEILSGIVVFHILKLPSRDTEDIIASLPVFIVIILWDIIIASILSLIKKIKHIHLQFNNKFTGINIAYAFLLLVPNVMFYATNQYNYPLWLLIYNIIANLSLVVLSIYNTHNSIELEIKKRDLINSELHNKSLKELLDSIRVFKHDYNNLIHAIGGYISCGDIKGLEKYYKGASKEAKRVNRLESISPLKINEPSVYGLIAGKFEFADSKGVDFNFESIFDYQKLDMPIYDFCKILGILLDNAIEAAEEVDELKEVNVYVRENKLEGYQAFVIENTYANKDVDTEQIYEKDFSTKNRNSGIGLWEVRRIVNKFDNVTLTTSKNDDYFRQELYVEIISKEAEEESPKELSSTLDS